MERQALGRTVYPISSRVVTAANVITLCAWRKGWLSLIFLQILESLTENTEMFLPRQASKWIFRRTKNPKFQSLVKKTYKWLESAAGEKLVC